MERGCADAVFILGDLFEVWVGDDDPDDFGIKCQQVLRHCAAKRPVFFMHGNRDFLVGSRLAESALISLLPDPAALVFSAKRWLLSHGDALCLADVEYQQFRATVRSIEWQSDFLAKPLVERQQIARGLRQRSEQRKAQTRTYADVDPTFAKEWLDKAQASHLIHGHTHRPGDGIVSGNLRRSVLSDWHLEADSLRAQVFRLSAAGQPASSVTMQRLTPEEAARP